MAYGGYARKAVGRALDRLPADGAGRVEDYPGVLSAALGEAASLVGGLKAERSAARIEERNKIWNNQYSEEVESE